PQSIPLGVIRPNENEPGSTPRGPTVVQAPALRVLPDERGALERLLNVRQVAELLGLSTATVYSLVERGELPHVRVSASIRFESSAIEAYITREGDEGAHGSPDGQPTARRVGTRSTDALNRLAGPTLTRLVTSAQLVYITRRIRAKDLLRKLRS